MIIILTKQDPLIHWNFTCLSKRIFTTMTAFLFVQLQSKRHLNLREKIKEC